ncbi:hypothetical protein BDV24DRAFT_91889 [Aspergillus arachidicola]|uniref:Short-chain dehydrogenase/reductase n=1 Tax=Aspergillus arachidicola TaxID=656916 RepID=A0A5N6YKV9_9EURO|nr:hypothetical protein BDV24DRAFT_91889 [Aspergillus arachidicola]
MTGHKVYFITGAGRGIARDLITAALEAGHSVVATARDASQITDVVGEHERLLTLSMDVTDPAAIEESVYKAHERFGSIDVLINNAGRFYAGFFETVSPDSVRAQMEVNFFGTLNVTRAILPIMRAQRRGHIVSVSALYGIVGAPFVSSYAASKFAMEGWAESLAAEVEPFGIRTTIVEPGAFRTRADPTHAARSVFPDNNIDDYAEATKKSTASFKYHNGREAGHPTKLAYALAKVVDMDPPPKRWVAGTDAYKGIIAKGEQLVKDANVLYELTTSLGWDDV